MLALLDFLSMIPNLTEAAADGGESSVLTGCERDTKHLAFKALTFLQQVGHNTHAQLLYTATVRSYCTQLLYAATVCSYCTHPLYTATVCSYYTQLLCALTHLIMAMGYSVH